VNTVEIDFDAIPEHVMDRFARTALRLVKKAFEDPEFAAGYERWRAEQKETETALFRGMGENLESEDNQCTMYVNPAASQAE